MKWKNFSRGLAVFLLVVYLFSIIPEPISAVSGSSSPSKLMVYVGPPKVLADRGGYDCVLVQLQDSSGKLARAPQDIVVSLSSSKTDIGSVDPTVTIRSGNTSALAKFFSTYTAGSTTITAVASGYTSGQATMSTVGPIPSKLAVYCFPPILPSDGKTYDSIIVQLQDASGNPACAPIGDVNVILDSSNTTVGTVDPSVTIKSGNTYVITRFYGTYRAGSTTITAVASGYTSGQATMRTSEIGEAPSTLKVYVGPLKVTAEGAIHESICVQLLDSRGNLARAPRKIAVTLTSSNIAVGTVEPTVTIPSGNNYAVAKFYSTHSSGSTTITAVESGYKSGQATMSTVGPIPSRLAVYCFPPILPADGKPYNSIIVQLQDASGNPARDPVGDISITLSSSNTEIGKVNSTAVIYFGHTYSTTKFYSSYAAGSTAITAAASDYTSGQATIKTYLIDVFTLTVSVTAHPTSIKSSEQTMIKVYVTYDTFSSTPGATIKLVSDKGGNFSRVTDERNGSYTAVFTAPPVDTPTIYIITVTVSKTGYVSGQGQVRVTINPIKVEIPSPTPPPTSPSTPILTWVVLGIIVAGVVIAIVIVKKRLGKSKKPIEWQRIFIKSSEKRWNFTSSKQG